MAGNGLAPILGASQEPAFVVDLLGSVMDYNASAARLLGVESARAAGAQCHELLRGRDPRGTPICQPDCPFLGPAPGQAVSSPIDMMIPGDPGTASGDERALAVRHIRLTVSGQALVLHLFEDVRTKRRRERVGTRLEALRSGETISGPLTRRELDVLRLVAEGLSSGEIARQLGIQPSTARNHIARILGKLAVTNRTAAVVQFLVDPKDATRARPAPKGSR